MSIDISAIIGIILGGGAVVAIGYFMKSNPLGIKIVRTKETKVTKATVEIVEGKDIPKPEESSSLKELSRRRKLINSILSKLKIFLVLLLLSLHGRILSQMSSEDKAAIRKYVKDTTDYIKSAEKEMDNIRHNRRKDTSVKITNITYDNEVYLSVTIPARDISFTKEGIKITKGLPIKRDIKVRINATESYILPSFDYDPEILFGGSYSFNGSIEKKGNVIVGIETFVYNTSSIRGAAVVFAGIKRFGVGLSIGSNSKFTGLRTIFGIGRGYAGKNDISFEVAMAAAIGL